MRDAGLVAAGILDEMCAMAAPGVSTWDLDKLARNLIEKHKVKSAFLGYYGYPAVVCTSINHEVVHGIPRRDVVLADGDIIGIDFGIYKHGYCADTARTVEVGRVSGRTQAAGRGDQEISRPRDRRVPAGHAAR